MNKRFALGAGILLAAGAAQAAVVVDWQSTGPLAAGATTVSTEGTLEYAYNTGSANTYTVNTVQFDGTAGGGVADLNGEGNVIFNPIDSGSTIPDFNNLSGDFGSLLDSAQWATPSASDTITLGNLRAGQHYLIQIFTSDNRGANTKVLSLDQGTANQFDSVASGAANSGAYVIGTFTADATGEAEFTFGYNPLAGNANINGIQVRAIAAPTSLSPYAVNVDVENTSDHATYVGQGGYADSGNNTWNRLGNNLLASDGTATTVDVSIDAGGRFSFTPATANDLMADYSYWNGQDTTITITGLTPGGTYDIYVYCQGDQANQDGTVTIGAITKSTTGNNSGLMVENQNYVVIQATADGAGGVTALVENNSSSYSVVNGLQIVDLALPIPTLSTTAGNPVSGPFTVTVSFTEHVTGLELGDFSVVNGTTTNLSGADATWSVDIHPTSNGDVTVTLPAGKVIDLDSNPNTESNPLLRTYVSPGSSQPVATLSTTNRTVYGDYRVQVDFSESVTGLELSDFVISGGTVSGLAGSGSDYTVVVSPDFGGDVTLSLPANSVTDEDGDNLQNAPSNDLATSYHVVVTVSTLADLLTYVPQSNVELKMTPGVYDIDESDKTSGLLPTPTFFEISGSNCTYDFTGVKFNVNTDLYDEYGNVEVLVVAVSGNSNHLYGLTIEDIGNQVPTGTAAEMEIYGDYNKIEECSFYVRGSSPYGYGDLLGKGGGALVPLHKHAPLLVEGVGCHILNCYIEQHAYGHCIYIGGAIDTLIEGCYIQGETRTTDEVLAETSGPAFGTGFMTVWGWPIPDGYAFSLQEAGIRAYNNGGNGRATANTTVKNCTVVNSRVGVVIGFSNGDNYIYGCTVIGVEQSFWPGDGNTVEHCQAEAPYATIIDNPYQGDNNLTYSITVLHETEVYGTERLVYLGGSDHNITLLNSGIQPRPYSQTVQLGGEKIGMRYISNAPNYTLSGTTVTNWTDQPVVLDPQASNCEVFSYGSVTNNGSGNSVSSISPVTITASASTGTMYNTVDANTGTHWSASGDGQWIQYDLGMTRNLHSVSIRWLNGSSCRYFFEIQTSSSPTGPWTTVFPGASRGVTADFEEYDFQTQNARYIRVVGYGNSVDDTIEIVDLEVDLKDRFALVKTKSDAGASYIAQNTVDGDFNTRWAAQGDGQWIQYDLLASKRLNAVWLAWYAGNTRASAFDIMTSDHPMGPWTTAYSGSSSGTTLQLEEYAFTPVVARFVRVTGHGNSVDDWNNITESFIDTGFAVPSEPIDPEDVVIGSVAIGDDGMGGEELTLSVPVSGVGHNYQVKSTEDLEAPVWEDASGVIPGNGEALLIEIPINPTEPQRYYKLEATRQ